VRIESATQRRPRLWEVLQHRDYALLFWGQLISASGTQMQVVAVAWQVLLLTHSAVALGLTVIVGAAAGGVVLAWVGVANTYWVDVASYVVVLGALLLMAVPRIPIERRARAGLDALAEGIRFLRAHPLILALMSLDFCATFFGSPRALLPVYAQDIYHAGAQGLGILLAATSIGAVIMTPLVGRIGRMARKGVGVVVAVLGWGVCIVMFGIAPGPLWIGVALLAGAGAADMISMILRNQILQLRTPDELRGRISAVNAMFVIGGPMLGQFESGVVAGLLTPELSVVIGGLACIAATVAIAVRVPGLLRDTL
jgi:Transmembrane secretion effector